MITPERMGKMLDDLRKKGGFTHAICVVGAGAKCATIVVINGDGSSRIMATEDTFKRAIAEAHMAIGSKPPEEAVFPSATATAALLEAIHRAVNDWLNMTPPEFRDQGIFKEAAQLVLSAANALSRIALTPTAPQNQFIEHLENVMQKVNDARAALTDLPPAGVTAERESRIQEALDFMDGARDIINKLTNGETNGEERSSS